MGSHTNSTIMGFVESVVKSLNTRIGTLESEHLATVYITVILLIQTATAGFYVGIENNTLMAIPIFYKAGYPWLGPGGIIDGCVTLWNVYMGIFVFKDGMKPGGLVRLAKVLAIGYVTGVILAYYPITDIDNLMQWVPTLFTVQRTIHGFLQAALSEPRDMKYFYMYGTLLSILHNLFIIENVTSALLFDLFWIGVLIGPHSSLNLVGPIGAVVSTNLLTILRGTLLFGNWSLDDLFNGSTYITLFVLCGYVIIYTESRNLFPDNDSEEERDFVTQALTFFFSSRAIFAVIVKKTGDELWDWFVNEFIA